MTTIIIKLNVGGKLYTTTRTTLENCGENMLSNLVSGKYSPTMIEDAYFIDRNGELFGDILDFLRNAEKYKLPMNSDKLNALLIEAEYYAIVPLIERVEEKIKHQSRTFSIDFPIYNINHNFECYQCSGDAPEDIRSIINKCLSDRIYISQVTIIEMAKQNGYHVIQSIPVDSTKANYVTWVRLIFQGY